jgi:uncharacterized protein (DUF433 family)
MAAVANEQQVIIRTERSLSIVGTRITLYDVMEYLLSSWPSEPIRHRLDFIKQRVTNAVAYIDTHRAEVTASLLRKHLKYWRKFFSSTKVYNAL